MIILKDAQSPSSEVVREYEDQEIQAIRSLDIDLRYIHTRAFGMESDTIDLKGEKVFLRHYANQDWMYKAYVEKCGGELAVPRYDLANHWFRDIPGPIQKRFFGRTLGWMDMTEYGYLDEISEHKQLMNDLRKLFDEHARREDGRLFLKADVKQCLTAGLYTYDEAMDRITYWIALSCHNRLRTMIWSEVVDIQHHRSSVNKKAEFRCLVVNNKVSSISLYMNKKGKGGHSYSRAHRMAVEFIGVAAQRGFLPHSYCLDLARLTDGSYVVVELNDIAASGLYADHDIVKFYEDVAAL